MISEVKENTVYSSSSGIRFITIARARHAQDCSLPMVIYRNLEPTHDYPPGQTWVIEESLFLKLFNEVYPNG